MPVINYANCASVNVVLKDSFEFDLKNFATFIHVLVHVFLVACMGRAIWLGLNHALELVCLIKLIWRARNPKGGG